MDVALSTRESKVVLEALDLLGSFYKRKADALGADVRPLLKEIIDVETKIMDAAGLDMTTRWQA